MHRVLVSPDAIQKTPIVIRDPRTLHHLLRVLRVAVGDPLECIDGQGRRAIGSILRIARQQVTVAVDRQADEPAAHAGVTLAQALIKPDRFEWAIEKATELGAARIIPMVTDRTTIRPSADRTGRIKRWQRIAESAAAQCGRATLPVIEPPQPFHEVLERVRHAHALLPTLGAEGPLLWEHLKTVNRPKDVAVLIGPEGDFTAEEIALAVKRGAHPVRLGRLTLRSETAAVAALAILQHVQIGDSH